MHLYAQVAMQEKSPQCHQTLYTSSRFRIKSFARRVASAKPGAYCTSHTFLTPVMIVVPRPSQKSHTPLIEMTIILKLWNKSVYVSTKGSSVDSHRAGQIDPLRHNPLCRVPDEH